MSVMASQINGVSIVHSTVCSKKTSKRWVTGLCEGNPPETSGFPSQRTNNTENVSIWWRHHVAIKQRLHHITLSSTGKCVIMGAIASQITSVTIVYSIVYLDADQRKHQSSASLAFVWGIHRDPWFPRTKGQLRGKCFHLMTSSCLKWLPWPQIAHMWKCVRDAGIKGRAK